MVSKQQHMLLNQSAGGEAAEIRPSSLKSFLFNPVMHHG